jgi:hypothetical protein
LLQTLNAASFGEAIGYSKKGAVKGTVQVSDTTMLKKAFRLAP